MKKNIFKTFILIIVSLFFFGCQDGILNPFQDIQKMDVKISGSLGITGAVPAELISGPSENRTAFPSMPVASYKVWVVDAATNQKVKDGDVDTVNMTYEISVEFGKSYYLCASAIYNDKPILIYKSEKITVNSGAPLIVQNIVLKPVVSANGRGNVFLAITMGSGVQVDKCIILWNGNNQQEIVSAPYIFNMNNAEVPSGSYDVTFRFYHGEHLVYEFSDLVHVFDNSTTNVWVKNGNEPYLEVDASGRASCNITKVCTDSFIQHVFYVDASRQNTNPSRVKYTTETGNFYNPCCTFALALEKAAASNSSSDNVRIFIKTSENSLNYHSEVISQTINPYINLEVETYVNTPGDKRGKAEFVTDISDSLLKVENNQTYNFTNIIFNGNENCTTGDGLVNIGNEDYGLGNASFTNCEFINAETVGVNVLNGSAEFEDCKFLNNHNEEGEGGGLFIKSDTSVTLSGTTQINGNVAELGGGIYTAGTLTIKGNCLIGDSTVRTLPTEQNYANFAGYGAGIYAVKAFSVDSDATLTLAGNYATDQGGGIYFYISGETENLHSTTIKYCATGSVNGCVGGGIYVDEGSVVDIKSSVIEHCNSREGGGIYAEGVPVILAQDAVITNNTAAYGGGVFVDPDGSNNYLGMQNNAYVASNNDVYLGSNTTIKLLTDLSLPDDANGVAAKITPENYTSETVLLTEGSTGFIAGNYPKFAVTNSDPTIEWYVKANGKLNNKAPGDVLFATLNGVVPTDTSKVYVMDTKEEFETFVNWINNGNTLEGVNFKLNTNITYTSSVAPIGSYDNHYAANHLDDKAFSGKFDGNNKVITVANYNIENVVFCGTVGLFAYIKNAEVRNLTLEGSINVPYVSGGFHVGSLIGHAENSLIENITNKCNITAEGCAVGGIVGLLGDDSVISKCVNNGALSCDVRVGGIVGDSYGNIHDVINNGNITVNGDSTEDHCAGGIVARTYDSKHSNWMMEDSDYIYNCKNTGTIKTSLNCTTEGIAGIVGLCQSNFVYNCVNEGTVENNAPADYLNSHVGGIIGKSDDRCKLILNCCNTGTIKSIPIYNVGGISGNSIYSTIAIAGNTGTLSSGDSKRVGAICGWPTEINFKNCSWLSQTGTLYGQIATDEGTMGYGSQNNCSSVTTAQQIVNGLNNAQSSYSIPSTIASEITIPENFELKEWSLSSGKPTLDISW